jgi:hypothetical protein
LKPATLERLRAGGAGAMGRIWLMAALLYGYGDPGFDGHRPAKLDQPLRDFHRAVDGSMIDARRTLVALDDSGRLLRDFTDRLHYLSNAMP